MPLPGRPRRLSGFPYDEPGPTYHVRIGTFDRAPVLSDQRIASAVVDALRFRHGRSADILVYCVMPDHVHLLISLRRSASDLSRWVGDLKRWLARRVPLHWQPGFYEHIVRKEEDLHAVANYILENPVRAGLAGSWRDYGYCGSLSWEL